MALAAGMLPLMAVPVAAGRAGLEPATP